MMELQLPVPAISRIVLASNNAKKLIELRRVFEAESLPVEVLGLADFPVYPEPAETARDFEGNALIKARAAALATGQVAVADDSGIEVDALNKMPGVRSARWAGAPYDDQRNLDLLLAQTIDLPNGDRTARFVCVLALVSPDGVERTWRATMEGSVAREARGTNGFGYDPIFVPDGYDQTSAELPSEVKDAISHRGKAIRAMVANLNVLLGAAK